MTENGNSTELISGTVEKILYRNNENGYCVLKLGEDGRVTTVVGIMPDIYEGESLEVSGCFDVHSNYGVQFKAASYSRVVPKNAVAVLKYLSAGGIKGIGPATAKKLVHKFKEKTLDILENDPNQIAKIKGITLKNAKSFSQQLKERRSISEIVLGLSNYGIGAEKALTVYGKYGADSVEIVRCNPYCLCGEGLGFTFEFADSVAESLGIEKDSGLRISAGLVFVLRHNLQNGHTCLPRQKLCRVASGMLGCNESRVDDACEEAAYNKQLRIDRIGGREFVFLPNIYEAEKNICRKLLILQQYVYPEDAITEKEISDIESGLSISFDEMQRDAVKSSINSGVLVLTGGPGTGKTTTLNAIIAVMKNRGLKFALSAPTGRAAKRITELTGYEAKTIHRLLEVEWIADEARHRFARNEKNPLDFDVIIIDEMSMVDVCLFDELLKAVRLGGRIILVGDYDQLPSVSAGNVLRDVVESARFKTIMLKKIFRQSLDSLITVNAHRIIAGESPIIDNKSSDFFVLDSNNPLAAARLIVELYTKRLPQAYGFSDGNSIQVLCPSRLKNLGTANLNNMLQQKINPNRSDRNEIQLNGTVFRVGDRVMQVKNNYDIALTDVDGSLSIGVFNGDTGFIDDIDLSQQTVKISFDNKIAEYQFSEMSQIELAYAVTVHKSQGSEFDCVILPLLDFPMQLRYRNLLYTAITRAKKLLVIVGSRQVLSDMIKNDRKTLRYTALCDFLGRDNDGVDRNY